MTREGMKAGKDQEPEKKKSRYRQIIDGEAEPEGREKGWENLEKRISFNMMDPEKAAEIRRKGAEAVNALKGEKRTAREALENILTLKASQAIIDGADIPEELAERLKRSGVNITMYDLLQLVAVGRAAGGNMKAYELVRDTYGDMPIKQIEISENITTDSDRELMRQLSERLQQADVVIVEDQTGDDNKG